jgi:preprotein translocase subunit SecE
MSGKAVLIVVAGFSLIFLVVGQNFGNISNRSVDEPS